MKVTLAQSRALAWLIVEASIDDAARVVKSDGDTLVVSIVPRPGVSAGPYRITSDGTVQHG